MGFLNNFFNMFRTKDNRINRSNNTANNSNLTNMKDSHVNMGEDPGSIVSPETLDDEQ